MPELPEVEVSRLGIDPHVRGQIIQQFIVRNASLRWPVDLRLQETLKNATITHTARRGKYLILYCACEDDAQGALLIHLGMSGSVRIVAPDTPAQKHDHIDWVFETHRLRYHDPRRFGSVIWHDLAVGDLNLHPRLLSLGIEPFDDAFTGEYFYQHSRNRSQAIKVALLAGDIVVGVGNIYASEVLFRCKIHPETSTKSLTLAQSKRIAAQVKIVLQAAIDKGGSTLKDFVNSDGKSGYFQMHYNVYDRAGEPCTVCGRAIQRIVQAQRATYFCAHCQPATQ
ncbi:bifunctional DNA-formamidopyrimidine glycosylase/DNA-(apurinic or apyrimidinic site) lyase [Hydromonas duriensis]|uniref:Formamidopyrimidine-DNA glycosylase n=1 Tax=Hydromonas duriensis TaxID=1527608 RepID=A0A4V3DJY9_9BURK|nr:bifunctional DNA-formamidopyrimidine glycosylase/DNA-(apurinic or apyrimidinic site) lyase [Hydromonas duriensis]TDR32035.1 DNA-(apurinic or apyrimidinic site) lyase [Hydromonas duriensis]